MSPPRAPVMPDDKLDPEVRAGIDGLANGHPYARNLAATVTRTREPALRQALLGFVCALLECGIKPTTANLRAKAVRDFLDGSGAKQLADLDRNAFRSYFAAVAGKFAPQVWYERQRHVLHFMEHHFGREEARVRCPTAKTSRDWHSNRPQWMAWSDLRKVWMRLDLQERAQFVCLTATGAPADDLHKLPVSAISIEPEDGLAVLEMPANRRRGPRHVATLFGERTLHALQRLAKDPTRHVKWIFPDPNDPTRHMSRDQVNYRVRTWGERADVAGLSPQRLQATILAHLVARGVTPEVVAYLAGLKHANRILHLLRLVQSAKEAGHNFGMPNFKGEAAGAGLATCEACGRDNLADAWFCCGCGAPMREDMTDRESQIKADIQRRFRMLLDLTGESEAQRVADALRLAGQGVPA